MKPLICTLIAGPNGAGKTTFALEYLPLVDCRVFHNADMIAAGLAPFNMEKKQLEAGRLFLREIEQSIVTDNKLFNLVRTQANMSEKLEVKEERQAYEPGGMVYQRPAKRRMEDVDSAFIGEVLNYAVAKELDRKRRLGFDAIIVENNMVVKLHPDGSKTVVGSVE